VDANWHRWLCQTSAPHQGPTTMSGFEIAGAVLGAFPILLQAANGLRGVYSDARTWWQFEREFDDFVAAVEREHIAFSQILEILLEPLYRLSYEEREELQTKPNSPLWTDERIEAELRERVSERYFNWFKKELRGLQTAVEELAELLPMYQVRKRLRSPCPSRKILHGTE